VGISSGLAVPTSIVGSAYPDRQGSLSQRLSFFSCGTVVAEIFNFKKTSVGLKAELAESRAGSIGSTSTNFILFLFRFADAAFNQPKNDSWMGSKPRYFFYNLGGGPLDSLTTSSGSIAVS